MIELDSRVRGPGQLPESAGVAGADAPRYLTETRGHVVVQEAMQRSLSTVPEATMEQVHMERELMKASARRLNGSVE